MTTKWSEFSEEEQRHAVRAYEEFQRSGCMTVGQLRAKLADVKDEIPVVLTMATEDSNEYYEARTLTTQRVHDRVPGRDTAETVFQIEGRLD